MTSLSRRAFLKLTAAAAAGGIGGYGYAHEVEPHWLEVTHHDLPLPRLAPDFDGYCIAHLSDLHVDQHVHGGYLEDITAAVEREKPDLVAITGDFVTGGTQTPVDELVGALRRLGSRDGIVAVLGNHDYAQDAQMVRRLMRSAGIADLTNTTHTLQRGSARLHIAGVDDALLGQPRLEDVVRSLPDAGAAVLLAHEPEYADVSGATGRFDLQLSGHSHGGQVRLPFRGALLLPPMGQKYPMGLYEVGGMLQYTSRGLGMLPPRVRLDCRPELAVLRLRSGRSVDSR